MKARLVFRSLMPASTDSVFEWHCRPGPFGRHTPPRGVVKVLGRTGDVEDGGGGVLAVRAGGIWRHWVAEHFDHRQGRQCGDVPIDGPLTH